MAALDPMLARAVRRVPAAGAWQWQPKHDGYRLLADTAPPPAGGPTGAAPGRRRPRAAPVALRTRHGADATAWFPELHPILAGLGGRHVLDGEVTVLDAQGVSDFPRLHARARHRGWYTGADPVVYAVFDLLVHDGVDIRALPLEARRARLRALVARVPELLYVDDTDDVAALWALVLHLRLEGMVGKRLGSVYAAGPSADWVKLKRPGAAHGRGFTREP
ncbi:MULTISPECIES: ATP-dependent DNA ligase [Cupriavidus]